MIRAESFRPALRALHRLLVQAKAQAYEANDGSVAELLNDFELFPEYIADETDRTGEFVQALEGIARIHPRCRYIVDQFELQSTDNSL